MDIGSVIKKYRKEIGLTQEELAKRLGYKSRSSVNKMENSRTKNSIYNFASSDDNISTSL